MKNSQKFIGIIAIAAIIVFSYASCITLGTGGDSGSSARSSSDYSTMPVIDWPADSVWSQYGLTGLRQPSGTRAVGGFRASGYYQVVLLDATRATYDNLTGQVRGMSGFTFLQEETEKDSVASAFMSASHKMVSVGYSIADKAVVITAMY